MAEIKIDYDGIAQQASKLSSLLSEYEGLNTRLKTLSSTISESWDGEAARAFSEMMGKYASQAQKLAQVIEAMRKHMTDTETTFEMVDQECANLINNSF